MSESYDADELAAMQDQGILGGNALDQYEGLKESLAPDGVNVLLSCRWCGKPSKVTLEWPELFIVGANAPGRALLVPPQWIFSQSNQTLYVAMNCSKCNNGAGSQEPGPGLAVHVTPDEARKYFHTALQRGFVNAQEAAQYKQHVERAIAQQGG